MKKPLNIPQLAILMNQGQACESGSRLFLHRDIHDAFLKELKAEFERIRVGDPLDPNTQMGTQVKPSANGYHFRLC